ncbi:MAG: twin transmembrane helix small protein [Pseudomonadota bacterium]|nr:twin transmembrane helix small protein [Pseudomonadota bacterium]
MSTVLPILLVVAMIATLGALALGLISMVRGGNFNEKYSNKIMRARVILQFAAIMLLALLFLFSTK